ncbi:Ganglioside gm2 activator protein [Entamoeba marina]
MFALILAFVALACAKTYPLTYTSCGPDDMPVIIHDLKIEPDNPIYIENSFQLTFDLETTVAIEHAQLALKFQKEVLFWITVPCEKQIGSCTYPDVCKIVNNITDKCLNATRPHGFDNVPCSCPIQPSRFAASLTIPTIELPDSIEWLVSGNYRVHFDLTADDETLSCYDMQFSLKTTKD